MDVLSDIFETIELRGTLYFRTEFSHPWGTTVPRFERATRFHYVLEGECWVRVGAVPPLHITQGDLILVTGGAAHVLTSAPDMENTPPLEQVLRDAHYHGERCLVLRGNNPQATTRLVCGHFSFNPQADHPLLRALPTHLVLRREVSRSRVWLEATLDLLVANIFRDPEAPMGVVTRLSEIVLIEALRSAGDEAPEVRRLIAGFADPRIGRAIALIHRHYDRGWRIEDLAREAGMSRTRFATRFRALIGMTPIAYLAEWRLQRAAALVRAGTRRIEEIAHLCGYGNAASFARAFSNRFGVTPTRARRAPGRD